MSPTLSNAIERDSKIRTEKWSLDLINGHYWWSWQLGVMETMFMEQNKVWGDEIDTKILNIPFISFK